MAQLEKLQADTVVIGAGAVGLAAARALARQGRELLVLEAGDHFGEGLSSRNSEVIHAGIYYPQDSLKALLCVRGRDQLYEYCRKRHIGHRKTGKWIVATRESQIAKLEEIQARARLNGVALAMNDADAVNTRLPGVSACAALYSPETGIIDSHGLMVSLLADLEHAGGQLVRRAPVTAACSDDAGHRLIIGGAMPCELFARRVINAAGLWAVPLAGIWQGLPDSGRPEQWFARGVYFSYNGRHPFSSLIYPVPEPGGLGVHLTLDLAGQARFGPDVEWITAEDYTVDPARVNAFIDGIRQWWPELDPDRLQPAYAGIRPKLTGPDGGFADFRIDGPADHGVPGLVNLFGIESPGLTSCLAIADYVAARV
ncbi:NAD(P)/FAD-dependent oxidoreductase [Marinobacter sp. GN3S48]|uniref:NAD(P)/FAD-dependent oxidoreductase n=1 Tax=Marinobacter sp. GN3S48 TaxID=3382302 RepID=UPI00387B6E6C